MRIIDLDETGVKLINSNKNQIYLSLDEVKMFVNNKYAIKDNTFKINDKTLNLSEKDINDFTNIEDYIFSNFE